MGTNFNLNRAMENKKTRFAAIGIILFILFFSAAIIIYQVRKGKNISTPLFQTTDKEWVTDTIIKRDTATINNNQKTEINIKQHNGDINLGK